MLVIADAAEDSRFLRRFAVVRRSCKPDQCSAYRSSAVVTPFGVLISRAQSRIPVCSPLIASKFCRVWRPKPPFHLENAGLYEERKISEHELRKTLAEVQRLKNQLEQENLYLHEEIKAEQGFGDLVGRSPALREVLRQIDLVAPNRRQRAHPWGVRHWQRACRT